MSAMHIIIMAILGVGTLMFTIKWMKRNPYGTTGSEAWNHTEAEAGGGVSNDTYTSPAMSEESARTAEEMVGGEYSRASSETIGGNPSLTSVQTVDSAASQRIDRNTTGEHEEKRLADSETIAPVPIEEILSHYTAYFATAPESTNTSTAVPVAVFPPTKQRGWWTYATVGLHAKGGRELVMYSYQYIASTVTHIGNIAAQASRRYAQSGEAITLGDTFALAEPLVTGSAWTHVFVCPVLFEAEGFGCYTNGERVVEFVMLQAISAEEQAYIRTHGGEALEELFVRAEVNALDLERRSVVPAGAERSEQRS